MTHRFHLYFEPTESSYDLLLALVLIRRSVCFLPESLPPSKNRQADPWAFRRQLIVQQGIAPVINHERRVSEVDQVEKENSCPIEWLSAAIGYPRVRSKLILIPLEFVVDHCARIRGRRIGR
jgi:hypothetical protein